MSSHVYNFYAALAEAFADCEEGHESLVSELVKLREQKGRLFCLGVGGGAANAAHAVNDFRKLCGIEAYAPTDGISELTARANDEGWRTIFTEWLNVSGLNSTDALMIFSVGGGTPEVSTCIYDAVYLASERQAVVLGVVGKTEGLTYKLGDAVIVIQSPEEMTTPVTEAAQVAVLHALVSDPRLQSKATKW